jgi:hypothetical protein
VNKPINKGNLIHQLILASLVANKPKSLANNVSEASSNRMAARWLK